MIRKGWAIPLKMHLRGSDNILDHTVYNVALDQRMYSDSIHHILSMVPYLPNIEPLITYLTEKRTGSPSHNCSFIYFVH